jgi:hypothetical protein
VLDKPDAVRDLRRFPQAGLDIFWKSWDIRIDRLLANLDVIRFDNIIRYNWIDSQSFKDNRQYFVFYSED